jgi:uncharacterized protein DUF1194
MSLAAVWRRASFAILIGASALLPGSAGAADSIVTDANLVTGLDISDSVSAEYLRLELEGMAHAISSPEFLAAVQAGQSGRIGFAVFAWHHNQFPQVVSWTLIASEQDARTVARAIEARLLVDVEGEGRRSEVFYAGRLTDLSQAIDHAALMLQTAPYAARRAVINIIGNGEDNVGEDAQAARDRAVEKGIIVNGVVLGTDPAMLDYYRREIVGGPGAFVMWASNIAVMSDVMARKFQSDIVLDMRTDAATELNH